MLQFTGTLPAGPAAGSFFSQLTPEFSYLVPLLVSIVALVVFAWRESSSGYAFSAGLVAQLSAALACLMSITRLGAVEWAAGVVLRGNHGGRVGRRLDGCPQVARRLARSSGPASPPC